MRAHTTSTHLICEQGLRIQRRGVGVVGVEQVLVEPRRRGAVLVGDISAVGAVNEGVQSRGPLVTVDVCGRQRELHVAVDVGTEVVVRRRCGVQGDVVRWERDLLYAVVGPVGAADGVDAVRALAKRAVHAGVPGVTSALRRGVLSQRKCQANNKTMEKRSKRSKSML